MTTTGIETVLNFGWALTCIGAFGVLVYSRRQWNGGYGMRHILSVFLAALSLFPIISASDDRVQLASLAPSPERQEAFSSAHAGNLPLAFQLEDLEHGQTAAPVLLAVTVTFFRMVRPEMPALAREFQCTSMGRAPPAARAA